MENKKYGFLNNPNPLRVYDEVLEDIKKYNRADTTNMSELEMNKFRHIAGPAYLTSEYYNPALVNTLGIGKEAKDLFIQRRGLEDTIYDLQNNQKGINIGLDNRNIKRNQRKLFDYIFETEIKPYRKN